MEKREGRGKMKRAVISSKRMGDQADADPDDVQERLVNRMYVHHDHGGREHGHDWDDWLKVDRALKSKGNKKEGVHPKPEEV